MRSVDPLSNLGSDANECTHPMEMTQRRCFGNVLDAVEALIRMAKTNDADGEILNIGIDQEITIADLGLARK
jgi:nucleoside-diphosphate-sugar epimerase